MGTGAGLVRLDYVSPHPPRGELARGGKRVTKLTVGKVKREGNTSPGFQR